MSGTIDKECYTLGYGPGAMDWMTSRTAEGHGAFLLPYLEKGMRLLDCGCGPGTLTFGFAQRIAPGEAIGIDRETSQSEDTAKAARRDDVDNLHFRVGDIYALPFDDDSFDIVFASAVLGSVANPDAVVTEMTRVLKPGGYLALKEFDHGGDIVWPQSEIIARSIELYHRLRTHNGHEARAGRRLKEFVLAAGGPIEYSRACYDQPTGPEQLLPRIERNNRLITEMLGAQYEALGWCSPEELTEAAEAWTEFAMNPAAVYVSTWFEAIGRKPVSV